MKLTIAKEQILTGLQAVQNVVRHAGNAPCRIHLARDAGRLTFTITDEGPGFPDSFLPRAFERFTAAQIRNPTSSHPNFGYTRVTTSSMPNLTPANNPVQAGFLGDYMWVTTDHHGDAHIVWADTRPIRGAQRGGTPMSLTALRRTAAGAAVPADRPIDGEDVSPVLRGEAFTRKRPLFWEFEDDQGFHYALRDGDSKLITDRTFEKRRFYDLARDRFEVEDRAAAEPTLVAALLERLRTFAADVAADPLRPR
jgi:hypothetical protein